MHNNKYASNTTFSCTNTNKGSSALSHASRFLRRMLATLTAKPHTLLSFGGSCEREEMKKEFTNGALLVRLKVAPRLHYITISNPEGLMHYIPITSSAGMRGRAKSHHHVCISTVVYY